MGFFDTQGEKLYKEMDRAMTYLVSVNKELKSEILEKARSLIPRLLEESARWSSEGKLKAARNLQNEAKRKRNFDVADYVSLFLSGAYLEALLLPNDPHAKHVRDTIEHLVPPAKKEKPESSSKHTAQLQDLIASCLVFPLALHYGRSDTNLSDFIANILSDDEEITWRVYCIAFGMMDAMAQMNRVSQAEHLAFSTMFFISKLEFSPEEATEIVGKLVRIKPDSPLFQYIYESGLAMTNYRDSQDLEEFFRLSKLLIA